ncbi:MAG: aromatic amino acid hydroxylase, partial [Bdellovibrio sp.]
VSTTPHLPNLRHCLTDGGQLECNKAMESSSIPLHLRKYITTQNSSSYTPVEQATWRYLLRQLQSFLGRHAHPSYLPGLSETGIQIDEIPSIPSISGCLEKFGWQALPVSGFIPPAAFMELQALSILPIASEMRSLEHLLYTPAPDIVHEAAGHAPMLSNPEFSAYLKNYASVARYALHSVYDYQVYDAIRKLSDLKESAESSPESIHQAEAELARLSRLSKEPSEATWLARMNWWTAEYGLFGTTQSPLLYGAGLLSSLGEARWCLSKKVHKRPLNIDCIQTGYDITEPQPQLFVTPNFARLSEVLEELAARMSFRLGGLLGLQRAQQSGALNSVQLNSGLQISGKLKKIWSNSNAPEYISFEGPVQLSRAHREIVNQGVEQHPHGFGTPIGRFTSRPEQCPSTFSSRDLRTLGFITGRNVEFTFTSGVRVKAQFNSSTFDENRLLLMSFSDCQVCLGQEILFQPDWGIFDMGIGSEVSSVFGGPADRSSYPESLDFLARRVPQHNFSSSEKSKFSAYHQLADWRKGAPFKPEIFLKLIQQMQKAHPQEWLFFLDAYELGKNHSHLNKTCSEQLRLVLQNRPEVQSLIDEGLSLIA